MTRPRTVTLALTGASGQQYGLRLLQCLLAAGTHVQLLVSKPARLVIATETDWRLPGRVSELAASLCERFGVPADRLVAYAQDDWMAPVASGSNAADAMVVCPCSTATLSAIACGASRSLIERAADVAIKERRRLIVVPRETPVSVIHLQNQLALARAGAVILPANPGFYNKPASVDDLVDFIVARILDHLDVGHELMPRWGALRAPAAEP